jgi:putative endonuclease
MKLPTVYIMTNKPKGVLYTGVTADLVRRVWQHRNGQGSRFAANYGCQTLAWYEPQADMIAAIAREKQIKGGPRAKKVALVEAVNPGWRDLWGEIAGG